MGFKQAKDATNAWLAEPKIRSGLLNASPTFHLGTLNICPIGEQYTIGHALNDYLAWERERGTSRRTINQLVGQFNAYLVPILGSRPVEELIADDYRELLRTVASVHKAKFGIWNLFHETGLIKRPAFGQRYFDAFSAPMLYEISKRGIE